MAQKPPKRPRDLNQLAKFMVDLATGNAEETTRKAAPKGSAAAELVRRGRLEAWEAATENLVECDARGSR